MSNDPDSLPKEFDVIIVGTGLCESILAAAFSRIGYSVLHLDRNPYYGESEATHSLNGLLDYEKIHAEGLSLTSPTESVADGEISIRLPIGSSSLLTNFTYDYYDISENERDLYVQSLEREKTVSPNAVVENPAVISSDDKPQEVSSEGAADSGEDVGGGETIEEETTKPTTAVEDSIDGVSAAKELAAGDVVEEIVSLEIIESEKLNPVISSYLSAVDGEETGQVHKLVYLKKKSNRFILDLSPKLLFARSEMIDLLITSDVARYCEFRTITQILTMKDDGSLQVVPCSRSDIFSTKTLSMIEKRILMKLLTLCMEYEGNPQYQEFADAPFVEFLKSQKLSPNLVNYVVHAIAMVPETVTTSKGLERTRLFIRSLGRYGSTPFLWPLYGGEINQAFCRMSAVFGGVYILHRTVSDIVVNSDTDKVSHVVCNEGAKIGCKWLICNSAYLGEKNVGPHSKFISRAVVIASGSLSTNSDREEAVLLSLPAVDKGGDPITLLELGAAACVCPKDISNLRVCHLTTTARSTAQQDLQVYVQRLFSKEAGDGKPRLLLACYFNMPDLSEEKNLLPKHYKNFYIAPNSGADISSDNAVVQAKRIFSEVCPGEQFLPRPPDPEDIIFCDDETMKQSAGESFTEEINDGEYTETSASEEVNKVPGNKDNLPDENEQQSPAEDVNVATTDKIDTTSKKA